MCWIKNEMSLPPIPLVSDGNVRIFKVCKMKQWNLCGYWYSSFNYTLGKEYQTTIDLSYDKKLKRCIGTQGFHSYDASKCKVNPIEIRDILCRVQRVNMEVVVFFDNSLYNISNYILKDNVFKDVSAYLVEGYLPKGTQYYVNEHGEIISDKIVLSKIIATDLIKKSQYYLNKK